MNRTMKEATGQRFYYENSFDSVSRTSSQPITSDAGSKP